MNKDFHYYGTYLAARAAGFDIAQSKKIAWAAQMTDDCTEELLEERKIQKADRVVTSQSDGELLDSNRSSFSDPNGEMLKKVRNIWMPFHFLPGNLDGTAYEYRGEKKWGTTKYSMSRDEDDFKCICLHNSDPAVLMINDTKGRYHAAAAAQQDRLLYLIGIRMHVLADTWAHEFFAGTPNYWINEDEGKERTEGAFVSPATAPDAVSYYSIFYLGHGQLGHWPDYGFLSYRYRPHWMEKGEAITKNNPAIFLSAFCQMTAALQCIRGNQTFGKQEYAFPDTQTVCTVAGAGITAGDILAVLRDGTHKDQSARWAALISGKTAETLNYDKKDPSYSLADFCDNAGIHRNMIQRYVNERGSSVQL